ncbi:hypothetical protein KR044_004685 [Drosophila immigrans]|nr:hypothetical protein KR044_004685 [Drosophila immigrans]
MKNELCLLIDAKETMPPSQNSDDRELDHNLQLMNNELCLLIDAKETMPPSQNSDSVLQDLNIKFNDLMLDEDAPEFEFHGYGCTQTSKVLQKRELRSDDSGAKKKSKPNNTNTFLVSHQKQLQLQKENAYNQNESNLEKPSIINEINKCNESSSVLRLMSLFKSLHYLLWSDFPSHQLNSVQSGFLYDAPMKCTSPKGFNVRHHVQVLCTKLERFLDRLHRVLETNRNLDLVKYTDCSAHLQDAFQYLGALRLFTSVELRQRAMQFINETGNSKSSSLSKYVHLQIANLNLDNGKELQKLLMEMVEHLKTAHIYVHVFNWEMDLEHRYSSAMTARHEAIISKSVSLANNEFAAVQPLQLSSEEQLIAERYQLLHAVIGSKEHKEFLNALVHSPKNYFPPEIIALCEPPKDLDKLFQFGTLNEVAGNFENFVFVGDILELPPSSPPRITRRGHSPFKNRGS